MVEIFFCLLVLKLMFVIITLTSHVIPTKAWRYWAPKKVILAVLPFGLIAGIEFISPSSTLTGYTTPSIATIKWQSENTSWTNTRLTWADVNHHLFETDVDGYLSKDTLRTQLQNLQIDIARPPPLARSFDYLKAKQPLTAAGIIKRKRDERAARISIQLKAIEAALKDLDTLYENGPITPQEALLWRSKIVEKIAISAEIQARQEESAAEQSIDDWIQQNPKAEGDEASKAQLKALQRKKSNASFRLNDEERKVSRARTQRERFAERAAYARPSQVFLTPPWPVEISSPNSSRHVQKTIRVFDNRHITKTGPKSMAGISEWIARGINAFDNTTRSPMSMPSDLKCYASIKDQDGTLSGTRTCEFHHPILINYDLTLADCDTTKDTSCLERWIFPDLTILLTDRDVTFIEPQPLHAAIRPASRWEITLNGTRHSLDQSITVAFPQGHTPRIPKYTLHQIPVDSDREVRVWKNFDTASFLRDEAYLRNAPKFSAAHAFQGYDIIAPAVNASVAHIPRVVWPSATDGIDPFPNANLTPDIFVFTELDSKRFSNPNVSTCFKDISVRPGHLNAFYKGDLFTPLEWKISKWIALGGNISRCKRANTITVFYESLFPNEPSRILRSY
ncbi:MAG: hypothetical protein ACPGVK_00315 [Halocynthiibacter sp.]